MEALQFAVIVAALALPLLAAVRWQLDRSADARFVRRSGAALSSEDEIEARSAVIGYYAGRAIYAWVQFMGMRYRFDGVTTPSHRHHVGERELYMEPGLLYVSD